MEIAWLARNLLELKIWVEYCSLSIINTLEFHEDAIRDLVDMDVKIGGLDKQTADELEAAKAFLCGKRLSKKYKKVEDAAQDTNLKPFYDNYCKILSKFVHPTALSLTFPEGGEEVVRAEFVKVGKQLAAEALEKLDTSCVGELYLKYLPTMQKLAQSHPGNDFFLGLHKP